MKHGEVKDHGRWCNECQIFHGILYECEKFPDEIRAKIRVGNAKFSNNLNDPTWIKRQIDNGVEPEVIAIFRALTFNRR